MLDYIVLGLLAGGPATGYELKTRIENGPGVFVKVSFGSLYPLLGRLCQKGEATMAQKTEGGRMKKYYTRTAKGGQRFAAWMRQPIDVREADNHRLAKIYFLDSLPPAERQARLAEYRQAALGYLEELNTRRESLLACAGLEKDHYFKLSTLYYGICVLQETLRWCGCIAAGGPLEDLLPPAALPATTPTTPQTGGPPC